MRRDGRNRNGRWMVRHRFGILEACVCGGGKGRRFRLLALSFLSVGRALVHLINKTINTTVHSHSEGYN